MVMTVMDPKCDELNVKVRSNLITCETASATSYECRSAVIWKSDLCQRKAFQNCTMNVKKCFPNLSKMHERGIPPPNVCQGGRRQKVKSFSTFKDNSRFMWILCCKNTKRERGKKKCQTQSRACNWAECICNTFEKRRGALFFQCLQCQCVKGKGVSC